MTLIVMLIIVCVLTFIAYQKSPASALTGLQSGGKLFMDILPNMILAFIAAGMISQVLPRELLTRWLGEGSGLKGLVIATLAGSVTPGGPVCTVSHCGVLIECRGRHCAINGIYYVMVAAGYQSIPGI